MCGYLAKQLSMCLNFLETTNIMASSLATIPFCLAQWPSLGLRKKKEWSNHVYLCTQWDHVTFWAILKTIVVIH